MTLNTLKVADASTVIKADAWTPTRPRACSSSPTRILNPAAAVADAAVAAVGGGGRRFSPAERRP